MKNTVWALFPSYNWDLSRNFIIKRCGMTKLVYQDFVLRLKYYVYGDSRYSHDNLGIFYLN